MSEVILSSDEVPVCPGNARTVMFLTFVGHNGDTGEAYYARPTRWGKFPGLVVIHHLPGWDEWIIEVARKFAHHGYATIACQNAPNNDPGVK